MTMKSVDYGLVSIVMPLYNAESLLGETIDSVLAQSYHNWELIVVDDCSTDGSREVVEAYTEHDPRIKLEVLENNFGGPAAPRNWGVRIAAGRWVAFLDSDDIWHPKKLELQLKAIEEVQARFSCTRMIDFSLSNEIDLGFPRCEITKSITFGKQRIKGRIPTSSVMVERELLERHPFNESLEYKAVEDYDCWLRILSDVAVCTKLHCTLLYYRKVHGQISGSKLYMLRKVFMVHRNYPGTALIQACLFTVTHLIGAVYLRLIMKRL